MHLSLTLSHIFKEDRLYTTDTKALNHILMNSYIYQKPDASKYNLTRIVGGGVLVAEEEVHRQQVCCMNAGSYYRTLRLINFYRKRRIMVRQSIHSCNDRPTATNNCALLESRFWSQSNPRAN